ncbi:MAG: Spx/MgsR family RNA polymerase-binding regulatory protein [Chlamydiales bacterium]|nr:Spx/MgsR family RNA polymerase-binding regulatory protein [Chlamydiales bacterium]
MIVYVYGKCSTCKDALRFLRDRNVTFTVKEISTDPPSIAELQQMLDYQDGSLKKLFNTSGLLYKEMRLAEKFSDLSIAQAFALLNQHGMLVKRPFVLGNDFGLLGFKESEWPK